MKVLSVLRRRMPRLQTMGLVGLLLMGLAMADAGVACAQTGTAAEGEAVADSLQAATAAPARAAAARAPSQAGSFAQGRKRVGFYGGAGSTLGQTYAILGGGAGFFVADGLEVGLDFEGWLLQSPNIWKLTPQVRYTVWQLPRFQPYIGAFWRKTFVSGFDDVNSWGGRAGAVYRSGKGYAGAGVVYERFTNTFGTDDDHWYPEVAFSLYF